MSAASSRAGRRMTEPSASPMSAMACRRRRFPAWGLVGDQAAGSACRGRPRGRRPPLQRGAIPRTPAGSRARLGVHAFDGEACRRRPPAAEDSASRVGAESPCAGVCRCRRLSCPRCATAKNGLFPTGRGPSWRDRRGFSGSRRRAYRAGPGSSPPRPPGGCRPATLTPPTLTPPGRVTPPLFAVAVALESYRRCRR